MEKVNLTGLTLDDIVFESRNQAYGAYDLRVAYERNITRAVVLAPLLLLLLVGAPLVVSNFLHSLLPGEVADATPSYLPHVLTNKEDIEIILEKRSIPPPAANTVKNPPLEVVKDNLVDPKDQPATVDQLKTAVSGPVTVDGISTDLPPIEPAVSTGDGTGGPAEAPPSANEIFIRVEQMPEYPGGEAAMLKFIGKHLRYPRSAQEKGITGVVYVTFVINPEGQVTQVKVLKGIDAACDAEALRVINKMPAWKPGRQSGRTVSVRYSFPIRFTM